MPVEREAVISVVRDVLSPLIEADGGQLYLVSVSDALVRVHLTGQFAGCPGNALVQRGIIEPLLAETLPGVGIEVSSGPLVPQGAERL